MKINIFTPRIERKKFSGGIYCILKYAQGLASRGHEVNVIAYPGSQAPEWIDFGGDMLTPCTPKLSFINVKSFVQSLYVFFLFKLYRVAPENIRREINSIIYAGYPIPDADISMATYWECAPLVAKYGLGKKCYFMQHFEVYFSNDILDVSAIKATYELPLVKIANSTWLKGMLEKYMSDRGVNDLILQSTNAVDLDKFYIEERVPAIPENEKLVKVISYGGRGVDWKGFVEMAEAIAIVRAREGGIEIEWNVYGDAALPPDNDIASYNSLGFLSPDKLRRAYNENDILLSASWYESFPLFPIEAMACGLAVITTEFGVEDYAVHLENSIVVEARNVESIAGGLMTLVKDADLRRRIAEAAPKTASKFSWNASVNRMERCLESILDK